MRAAALIPNFDNARTLGDVIRRTLAVMPDVLVVDDGSTDASWDVIMSFGSRLRSVRHPTNLGKGRALRDGFEALAAEGFTHAVALDADGQHFPEDLPVLLDLAAAEPTALIVGARDLRAAGAPRASRFGLWCSNAGLRVLRGVRIADSQSGLRCYPLAAILGLGLRGDRYDFEMEALFEAARAGIPIRSVPIRVSYAPEGGRVSHFRPVRDFLQIGSRVARSLIRRRF